MKIIQNIEYLNGGASNPRKPKTAKQPKQKPTNSRTTFANTRKHKKSFFRIYTVLCTRKHRNCVIYGLFIENCFILLNNRHLQFCPILYFSRFLCLSVKTTKCRGTQLSRFFQVKKPVFVSSRNNIWYGLQVVEKEIRVFNG